MKKSRLLLTIGLLAFAGASTTLTSCGDDTVCPSFMEGDDCKDEVRANYYNTYRGTASDNHGGTYTDWALRFSSGGSDVSKMKLEILDDVDANKFLFDATLKSNTSFEITPKTMTIGGVDFEYSGNGNISATTVSFTLTEKDKDGVEDTYIYTFNNFNK